MMSIFLRGWGKNVFYFHLCHCEQIELNSGPTEAGTEIHTIGKHLNQSPKGIKWSCFCSGPDKGRSPVEWWDFPYVRTSVHSPILAEPEAWLAY